MRKQLDKVNNKINIEDYSLKEIAEYFIKYDNYVCIIKTENKIIKFKIHKNIFSHLIELQHLFKTNREKDIIKGDNGLNLILKEKITTNNIPKPKFYYLKFKERIEYLPMFFNTITKKTKLKIIDKNKIARNTLLKANYALYKNIFEKNKVIYPMLSIKNINANLNIIETFIVENNISLLGALNNETILNISLIPPKILQKT